MPDEFLLTYANFDDALTPFAETQVDSERSRVPLFGEELSFEFDLSERRCTGWVDLKEHKAHPCPDSTTVDKKYENCSKCRELTGFNPAFYHATQVSEQQEHINQQPHFVYLAYFSPDVIKVGISQEARGLRRIVEQGARMALKLDTFSSANVARQYEARLAGLDGVKEHVSFDAKLKLLEQEFNPDEAARRLQAFRERAEKVLNVSFEGAELVKS